MKGAELLGLQVVITSYGRRGGWVWHLEAARVDGHFDPGLFRCLSDVKVARERGEPASQARQHHVPAVEREDRVPWVDRPHAGHRKGQVLELAHNGGCGRIARYFGRLAHDLLPASPST